jgi:hypothetical protein
LTVTAAQAELGSGRTLALVLGALLAGAAAWLLLERDSNDPAPSSSASEPPNRSRAPRNPPEPPPAAETPSAAKLRELNAMPETYRNTTFLTAIRDAGFVCYGIDGAYGGVNDSAAWTVACYDMLAYTVRVDGAGTLVIEPMIHYFDSVLPVPIPNSERPPNVLPPRR